MTTYTLAEAKSVFSRVIEEVESGTPVLITKHGRPAALITRPQDAPAMPPRNMQGFLKEELGGWKMPEDFDRMAADEIAALFEGGVR